MARRKLLLILCIAAMCFGAGCATETAGAPEDISPLCFGKCDDGREAPHYEADLAALNAQFPGQSPITTIEDAFRVNVRVGPQTLVADTHLFGDEVNIIPYENGDQATDAAGNSVGRGDSVIAAYFPPGQIGYAIKHHRPSHRDLEIGGDPDAMKEHFKLQDTHIELVVGVRNRDGSPGVITLNNPQTYEGGRFGEPDYPMVFVHPEYPAYLSDAQKRAFNDNIRTMMVGFNAVSVFPGDYNGGDPLGARTPAEVLNHVTMMVKAIAGDEDARAFFNDDANKIYCAELAHVATSAGLLAPLNKEFMEPLVGKNVWGRFESAIKSHNRGSRTAFTELNENEFAALVDLKVAPDDLQPAPSYASSRTRAEEETKLAFEPMTMSDIIENFLRTHLPREVLGESLAPVQAAVLEQMKPGLLETMGMDTLSIDDPKRVAVEQLFASLVQVVGTEHASYDAFRAAVAPLLEQARTVTGPRDGSGTGLFVPPSLLHLIAQGDHLGGLMRLVYVGHGLHFSQTVRAQ